MLKTIRIFVEDVKSGLQESEWKRETRIGKKNSALCLVSMSYRFKEFLLKH